MQRARGRKRAECGSLYGCRFSEGQLLTYQQTIDGEETQRNDPRRFFPADKEFCIWRNVRSVWRLSFGRFPRWIAALGTRSRESADWW